MGSSPYLLRSQSVSLQAVMSWGVLAPGRSVPDASPPQLQGW